ncbi:RHS repeat-associated core domain-containing protein [Xanthomonas euvesicatoria]|uniref:RHS repeat-associated protein n=1 Tax=Xanthomonas euvesicatoria TaxID=456327 RepID=A0AAW3TYU6_XANEU|nr:RHS repeat-associated core domain-containing protein [Xanthomonas euvesicatoria]MBB4721720.1 RHS repeat-associated protein [Xanthomonas euvesicatoria]MBB4868313.1 RHS repeat-associated protein [Xanthomonas euvesicatoria]
MHARSSNSCITQSNNSLLISQKRFTGIALQQVSRLIVMTALCLSASAVLAQDFEVSKIPPLPGELNPEIDNYGAGCRILQCGGQGNGLWNGQPASIVVISYTGPEGPELRPYIAAGFSSANNCTTDNSTCRPSSSGYFPTLLAKHWQCPAGFDPNPSNFMTCIRRPIDPGKNNECDASTSGSCTAGNPVNFFTGAKIQKDTDFSAPATKLQFARFYTSGNIGLDAGSPLGIEWRHSYMRSIRANLTSGAKTVLLTRPSGNSYLFKDVGSGEWHAESDVRYVLEEVREDRALVSWHVHAPDQTIEEFDAAGNLQKIDYPDGDFITFRYSEGKVSIATDANGRSLAFSYKYGHLDFITLPDGGRLTYAFDDKNRLQSASTQDGSVRSYLYQDNNFPSALTGVVDEQGIRFASWEYDQLGRGTRSYHGAASDPVDDTKIAYDQSSATVTSALGASSSFAMNVSYGRAKFASATTNCPACGTSQGIKSQTYDVLGYADVKQYFNGTKIDEDYNARGLRTLETTSRDGLTIKKVAVDWHPTLPTPVARSIYSGAGDLYHKQEWTLTQRGQILTSEITDGKTGTVRKDMSSFCEQSDVDAGSGCPRAGLQLTAQHYDGIQWRITHFNYYMTDDTGCASSTSSCPHRKGDSWKVTNALSQTTEYLAYDGAGRPLSIKDANGIVTDYTYHPRGWLTATKVRGADASSEADDRITRIDYWPTGLVKQVTQPDGAFTAFSYDAAHRLTDITDNAGNTVHYTLDNAGNRIKEDTSDASGTLKRTLSRVYNQLGQLKTQATAASDPTDFAYDANGNTTTVTDALATATQSEYDPLNRLSRTLQDVAGIKADTKFEYDALDNLTKVTDPKGLNTTYDYNGFGDLVKLTSPDTGVTSYTYDNAGNRATQTDARGNTTAYSYDALNRLTKVTYPTTSLNVTYTYDVTQTACTSGETFSIGRLTKMQDGGAITQYCYNRFGDLVRKVQTSNGTALVLRYDYTVGGQLRRMTYPDGAVVDYVRNAQGQTTQVGVTPAGGSRQVLLGNASYYPFGPAAGWTYGNGRTLARQYDLDYRPQAIQDTRPGGLDVGFGFDPAGNLTALTPAGNTTPEIGLGYDTLGRLTGFKDGRTGTLIDGYSYDATGNRLSAKVGTATQVYAYPTDSHRLSAVAGVARTYDATGNTTAIGGTARQYTYDTTGRMTQARRAGAVTMNYRYNGRGEQVRRFLGTTNTYTLYDEAGRWLGDYDSNGAPKQQAIWLDDLPVGLLANANKLHYIEPDHLGSPRVVIDPTRDVAVWTWSLKGEAFGNTAPNQDPDGDGAALVLDMRFPGQRFDAASGLNQNYFRDYDPATGRYGQSDPFGLRGGISTFGYALQGPFVHMDFYGLATWKGSTFGIGVGAGKFGLNIDFYQVTSPCPGGGLASAYVMAVGGAAGLGTPISMAGSQVELTDSNDVPDPDVFNGPYAKFSGGSVSFGMGYQMYQKISIGGAWWNFGAGAESIGWHQSQGGFDATVYGAAAGNAVVIQQKKCSCEAQ